MAIRYFLSISCLIHVMIPIILYLLYPNRSAEAIRKEILVYIVEPMSFAKSVGKSSGKIKENRSGPVYIPVKEDTMNMPAVSEERDAALPVAEGQAEEFAATGLGKEFADRGEGGFPKAGHSGMDDTVFGGETVISDNKHSSFNSARLREVILGKIRVRKTYPVMARKLGIEGDVHMSFWVFSDGKIREIAANGKHEHLTILEKAAVELIRNASPFHLPPSSGISVEGVPIQLVISYQLEDRKGGGRE